MGVHPEPALSADDVRRLVSGEAQSTRGVIAAELRSAVQGYRKAVRACAGWPRRILAVTTVGLALGVVFQAAVAHDGSSVDRITADLMSERFRSVDATSEEKPGETATVALFDRQSLRHAIIDRFRAAIGLPRIGEDSVRFGERDVPRALVDTVTRAAEVTGIDPAYMMALADKESTFNPSAKARTSSALGLFQFLTGTWLEMIRDYGAKHGLTEEAAAIVTRGGRIAVADGAMRKRILALRTDPYIAGLMAGELIKRDRARIETRIGRELKTTELYLAHFLGAASAGRFLNLSAESPDTLASNEFRGAARANRSLFTASENGKRRPLTVSEVHARLDGLIDRRITLFESVSMLKAQPVQEQPRIETPRIDARLHLPSLPIPTVQ